MSNKGRRGGATRGSLVIGGMALLCLAAAAGPHPTDTPASSSSATPSTGGSAEPSAPPIAAPRIIAPQLSEKPEPGKGRLALVFSGNRRWCTFPDDRPIKPLEDPRKPSPPGHRNEVYTFGYLFTVAAIKRGAPDRPMMLFESPVFRTAQMMPSVKAGAPPGPHKVTVGPSTGAQPRSERGKGIETGATLVPVWQEMARCTTLPERFEFDLDPGSYDLYVAFDLLGREGGWGHRTTDYLTDVPVEAGRATRLDAVANMRGATERQLSLDKASLLPPSQAQGADGP